MARWHGARFGIHAATMRRNLELDTMTRKDYITLARAINAARSEIMQCGNAQDAARRADMLAAAVCLTGHIAAALASDDARFDRERFIDACVEG